MSAAKRFRYSFMYCNKHQQNRTNRKLFFVTQLVAIQVFETKSTCNPNLIAVRHLRALNHSDFPFLKGREGGILGQNICKYIM